MFKNKKLLEINLTNNTISDRELEENIFKNYLGGSGIAAKLLYHELQPNLSPLHPDSPLLFFSGLLTGTPIPTASKLSVCAKSPLTGIWNEATVGGKLGAELRFCGYEGIIVIGKAEKPIYLYITPEKIKIKDAEEMWGQDTYCTSQSLKEKHGPEIKIASIGQAGENLVNISSIVIDAPHYRLAGRGGLGAVMGSKNLKAIVVKGNLKTEINDPLTLKEVLKTDRQNIRHYTEGLHKLGTAGSVEAREYTGDLPIKNFARSRWQGASKITGQVIADTLFKKHYACFACPIACGKEVKIKTPPFVVHGPEYETVAAFGSLCLNDNLDSIVEANDLCNRYGIDTISFGISTAFAIEACEKGFLNQKDFEGINLEWGNSQTIINLIHQVAKNEGPGRLLGQGVRLFSKKVGKNSGEFAIHVKGLELPLHDPRAYTGMALSYATANRGGCHLESLSYAIESGIPLEDLGYGEDNKLDPHTSDGKAELVIKLQNYMNVFNALGLCKFLLFGRIGPTKVTEWLNCVTGWDLTPAELLTIGERLHNLKRMYNVKLGINRKDDTLPARLLTLARNDGMAAGVLPELDKMLEEYYRLRGWDEKGIPSKEKLKQLNLN
jgi:aldehyde:ferredoxin oxidoreductase